MHLWPHLYEELQSLGSLELLHPCCVSLVFVFKALCANSPLSDWDLQQRTLTTYLRQKRTFLCSRVKKAATTTLCDAVNKFGREGVGRVRADPHSEILVLRVHCVQWQQSGERPIHSFAEREGHCESQRNPLHPPWEGWALWPESWVPVLRGQTFIFRTQYFQV